MAKFLYRMQNILNIKYKLEEQAKQKYTEIRIRYNIEEDKLFSLIKQKNEYIDQYRDTIKENLHLLKIEEAKNAIMILDEYILRQKNVLKALEIQLEKATFELEEAMKERKIHEKLKDNAFEDFMLEINAEEAKEIDQIVSFQYNKNSDEEK